MRAILGAVAACFLVAEAHAGDYLLLVHMARREGMPVEYRLQSGKATKAEVMARMRDLAAFSTNAVPTLHITGPVLAAEVFGLIAELRQLGLHKFSLMVEGNRGTQPGEHLISIDTSPENEGIGYYDGTNAFLPYVAPTLMKEIWQRRRTNEASQAIGAPGAPQPER